jgi:hypothetical protein
MRSKLATVLVCSSPLLVMAAACGGGGGFGGGGDDGGSGGGSGSGSGGGASSSSGGQGFGSSSGGSGGSTTSSGGSSGGSTTSSGGSSGGSTTSSGGSSGVGTSSSGGSSGGVTDAGGVQVGQPMPIGDQTLPRRLIIENRCTYTVWADALPKTTLPNGVPLEVMSGQAYSIGWPNGWSGRVWGRTGCTGNLTCVADKFVSNSLAEFTLAKAAGGMDWYDVSLVDGYNIPIGIINVGHNTNASHIYDCGSPVCAKDLLPACPMPLQHTGASGNIVACKNDPCSVLGNNDPTSPYCKYPNQYTQYFKMACPTSYSWPYDDPTSTFTCKTGKDYQVVFCPSEGATPGLP